MRDMKLTGTFFLTLFIIVLIRTAWVCDDAFITFRTIDNWVHGYGLRYNIAERVQSYTHPLWMIVLSLVYFITREFYYTVIALTVVISCLTFYLFFFKLAVSELNAVITATILVLSKAFVDYSTCGLENPLTHLLLVVFFFLFFRLSEEKERMNPKNLFCLLFVGSLLMTNRLDTVLLIFPVYLYLFLRDVSWREISRKPSVCLKIVWRKWDKQYLNAILLGFAPIVLWELFSLFYYGFLFPNTAYAKLNTGLHPSILFSQGMSYVWNSLSLDPITLFAITAAILYTAFYFRENKVNVCICFGIALYLLYVVKIGGDFMSGRFFTAPFVCAMVMLSRIKLNGMRDGFTIFLVVLLLVAPFVKHQAIGPASDGLKDQNDIADERIFWSPTTGLLAKNRLRHEFDHKEVKDALADRASKTVNRFRYSIGMYGYFAGPEIHAVDLCALVDPLLARLPMTGDGIEWRVGHFMRSRPGSYMEALVNKRPIDDPSLRAYWEHLSILTRGRLFSPARWWEIVKFNLGCYDYLIDEFCEREFNIWNYSEELNDETPEGYPWYAVGNFVLNEHGVGIRMVLNDYSASYGYKMSLHGGHRYKLIYLTKGEKIAEQTIDIPEREGGGMTLYEGTIPAEALRKQFDLLRVKPVSRDGTPSLGHFLLIKQ